eukprot:TRINITY_DN11430_c0_g2_i2.p1 TRINITY_DN11430_c0_g2~~TRINITY_DN11430_c0_g2_i2.p1  ORF type:complete len:771 (+),score=122.96 TRINITY_DN11430_c0_g2_i2:92-2404(+)
MIGRPPRSTLSSSSAASDVYKRQGINAEYGRVHKSKMALLRGSMSPSVMIVCAVVLLTLQCGYVISTLRGINAEVHTAILAVHKQLLQHSKEHVSNEHQISQDLSMHRSEMKELLRAEVSEWQQTKLRQASELQVLELKQKLAEVTAERDTAERHLADAKDNSPTLRTNALRAALHKEQAAHDWTRRDLGSSRDELDTMRETLRAQDLNTTAIRLKSELEAAKARLAAASGKLRQCAQKWNPKDGTGKGECAAATSLFCPEEPAPAQALPFRRDWSDIDEHSNTSKQLAMAPGGGWQAYVPWSSQPSWEDCMILDCVRTPQCHGKDRLGGAHMLLAAIANGDKPCCSDVLLEVMLRFSQFMRAKNVSHFLSYGSLLGSVRSSDLIPWTNDVDLTVPAYAISRIMSPEWQSGLKQVGLLAFRGGAHAKGIARTCLRKDHPTLKKLHADCDTAIHRKFLASKSRETFYIQHFPYGDVYVTHPSPLNPRALYTRALIAHTCTASESSKLGWNCKIPTDMCVEGDSSCIAAYASEYFPLRPCSVQGHQMPCARDPFSFLHRRYGPLWYQPTKNNPTDVALKSHKSELNAISVSQVSAIPSADKLRKAECLVTEWSNWEPCRVRRVNLGAKGRKVSLQACVQHRIRLKLETEYEKHSSKCKLDAVELCQWSDCGSELPPAAATEGDLFTAPRPAATLTPAEMEAAHRDHAKVEQMLHRTAAPTASPVDHDTPKVPSLGVDAAKVQDCGASLSLSRDMGWWGIRHVQAVPAQSWAM